MFCIQVLVLIPHLIKRKEKFKFYFLIYVTPGSSSRATKDIKRGDKPIAIPRLKHLPYNKKENLLETHFLEF
jgi:hypothetical protein